MSGLLEVAWRQHIGDREEQQDAARVNILPRVFAGEPERRLLVVADGMGGMASGALAARTAVQSLRKHVVGAWSSERTRIDQLGGAFHQTHIDVKRALAGANGGCALTACYVRGGPGGIACFAHAGDVMGMLLRRAGSRPPWMPANYRVVHRTVPHRHGRHALSRCIGTQQADRDEAQVTEDLPLEQGDLIVLASDGVADSVDEAFMLRLAKANPSAPTLATALLTAALRAAPTGRDDATVMVARINIGFLRYAGSLR